MSNVFEPKHPRKGRVMHAHSKHDDGAFNALLGNVLKAVPAVDEGNEQPLNDRHEQLLALQRQLTAATPAYKAGQFVKWKPGLQNRLLPLAGELAIVLEVLAPPVINPDPTDFGNNLFREPLSLMVGAFDNDGDFIVLHVDGRRFQIIHTEDHHHD